MCSRPTGTAARRLWRWRTPRSASWLARVLGVAAVILGVTYVMSVNRSVNPNVEIRGIPYVLPLILVLVIVMTVVLKRRRTGGTLCRRR